MHQEIEKKNNHMFNKNHLKKMLNQFDFILIDKRLSLVKSARELGGGMQVLMRKRKFPFPVKVNNLSCKELITSLSTPISSSTHFLLSGGKEFSLECTNTDMPTKDAVKNVLYSLFRAITLILHGQETSNKHNRILHIELKTENSVPIPIFENGELDQIEEIK